MDHPEITQWDRALARVCVWCPVCRHARSNPESWCARVVRTVEDRMCPFCRARARIEARKRDSH